MTQTKHIDYSISEVSDDLLIELKHALQSIEAYGSVEVYVQNSIVTQITIRNIKKTNSNNQKSSHSF